MSGQAGGDDQFKEDFVTLDDFLEAIICPWAYKWGIVTKHQ